MSQGHVDFRYTFERAKKVTLRMIWADVAWARVGDVVVMMTGRRRNRSMMKTAVNII